MYDYSRHRAWLRERGLKSYSQFGEDIRIEQIFSELFGFIPKNGVFLELGAVNGITHSNTLHFAELHEWTGFLIEPSPLAFKSLEANRPESQLFNCAIHHSESSVMFYGHNSLGVVADKATDEYLDRWHQNQDAYSVPAVPISTLINVENAPSIDLFSLDVEGSEYEVLSTFDWNIKVGLICVELFGNFNDSRREECRTLITSNGFELYEKFHINEIYIHRENLACKYGGVSNSSSQQ